MTLEEAIALAEQERGSKVVGAGDCGDRWAFGFEDDLGKTDGIPLFVYKADGRCEYFAVGKFMYDLIDGKITYKSISLPNTKKTACLDGRNKILNEVEF